jgi:hypothetical protein
LYDDHGRPTASSKLDVLMTDELGAKEAVYEVYRV